MSMELWTLTTKEWAFFLTVMGLAMLVTLAIPVVRDVVKGIFGLLLMPAFLAALKTLSGYLVWLLKLILSSHWILIKNVCLPRPLIYRTLDKDEDGVVRR